MRLRTNWTQFVNSDYSWTYHRQHAGTTDNNSTSYQSASRYSAMQDVETPDFAQRSARGEVILSPMVKLDYHAEQVPMRYYNEIHLNSEPSGKNRVYTNCPMNFFDDHYWVSDVENCVSAGLFEPSDDDRNEAIAAAWANVDESELQLLASIGELPETVRWIASIYRRSISLFRKQNQKKAFLTTITYGQKVISKRELANLTSQYWLEYRYAFRPLVFEMKQAVEAFHKVIEKRSRATGRGYKHVNSTKTEEFEKTHGVIVAKVLRTWTYDTTYRAGVLYKIEDDLNSLLAVWGIDQPLESIWELIPFSFIIDWFLNVGDVIASWTTNAGLSALGSWIVENRTKTITETCVGLYQDDLPGTYSFVAQPICTTPGSYNYVGIAKRRVINPPKSLIPSFKLNLNTAKIFDLATIAWSLYNNGGRVKIGGSNVR